jgi:hypothetical protein
MTNNFIGIYENVVPDTLCDELIKFFESCDKLGFTVDRQQHDKATKLQKHDDSLFITKVLDLAHYEIISSFSNIFWSQVYPQYADQYHTLSTLAQHKIFEYKLQRTPVGGGYHVWHSEQGDKTTSARILTFTCYLNDVDEGGETEFLYYPKRIPAKKGTFVLFPGGFTHTHRGNPPISNTKYIVTGWLEFVG